MSKRKAALMVAGLFLGVFCIGQALSQDTGGAAPGGGRGGRGGRAGGFDANVMRLQAMDRLKTAFGASDEDMKALQPAIEKVQAAQREARVGGMGGGMMGGRGGRGGAATVEPTTDLGKAAQALQKVLDNKEAGAGEIKTALQAFRDARAKAEAALEEAMKKLREVLSVRQEAVAEQMGLIKLPK